METSTDIQLEEKFSKELYTKAGKKFAIKQRHMQAMEMKYQGYTYPEITEKLGIPWGSLNAWFKVGGILYEPFFKYAEEQNALRKKEAGVLLAAQVRKAVAVLIEFMQDNKNPSEKFRAAVEVLDRILGKPLEGLLFQGELNIKQYSNLSNEQLEQRIKELNGGETTKIGEQFSS